METKFSCGDAPIISIFGPKTGRFARKLTFGKRLPFEKQPDLKGL
jgi:hypothetical protein